MTISSPPPSTFSSLVPLESLTLRRAQKKNATPPGRPPFKDLLDAPSLFKPCAALRRMLLLIVNFLQLFLHRRTPETSTTPKGRPEPYNKTTHCRIEKLEPKYTTSQTDHIATKRPRYDSIDQHPHLCGAYAPSPAPQVFPPPDVIGSLPQETAGLFARIGPNPYYVPRGGYHVFDGDGCVASIRIHPGDNGRNRGDSGGSAIVRWERVDTDKLGREKASGGLVRRENLGGIVGVVGLIKVLFRIMLKGIGLGGDDGVANTSLCWWGGRLMALYEGGLPWALKVKDTLFDKGCKDSGIETIGRVGFGGMLEKERFSAHPRPGPDGLLYSVNYKVAARIPAEVVAVDRDGRVVKKVDIPLRRWSVIHDTCVTKRFILVMDLPLVFSIKAMLRGNPPIEFQENEYARLGLMPLEASSHKDIQWFDVESGFIFHTVAAWEEENSNKLIFWACRMRRVELSMGADVKNEPKLWRWELDLSTGKATGSQEYGEYDVDFPTVDDSLLGGPVRYCYLSILEREQLPTGRSPMEDITGVVKYDLKMRRKVGELRFAGRENHVVTGGESQFIRRQNAVSEDHGYLMTLVHNWTLNRSELRVYDAKSLSVDPVASIVMKDRRIPSGFHTLFVPEKELDKQKPWM